MNDKGTRSCTFLWLIWSNDWDTGYKKAAFWSAVDVALKGQTFCMNQQGNINIGKYLSASKKSKGLTACLLSCRVNHIDFEVRLLVFKALNGLAATNLSDMPDIKMKECLFKNFLSFTSQIKEGINENT